MKGASNPTGQQSVSELKCEYLPPTSYDRLCKCLTTLKRIPKEPDVCLTCNMSVSVKTQGRHGATVQTWVRNEERRLVKECNAYSYHKGNKQL